MSWQRRRRRRPRRPRRARRKARRRASGLAAKPATAARTCTGARRPGSAWTRATRSSTRYFSHRIRRSELEAPTVHFFPGREAIAGMRSVAEPRQCLPGILEVRHDLERLAIVRSRGGLVAELL